MCYKNRIFKNEVLSIPRMACYEVMSFSDMICFEFPNYGAINFWNKVLWISKIRCVRVGTWTHDLCIVRPALHYWAVMTIYYQSKKIQGGRGLCSSVPWILIHVKYFMKAGSWAKVMSKNDSIVNNYAWFCPNNIANWMQQTLTQRVLFLPILWMNWSMLMNFETHHTCIQICYMMKWIYHKWIRTRCI